MSRIILNNRTLAMLAVAVTTLILQIPGIGHWYGRVSEEHTHIVTIVDGIIGLVVVIFATKQLPPPLILSTKQSPPPPSSAAKL